MGEKIKDLSTFIIQGHKVRIELNDGYDKSYSKYDIHIQSDIIQYYLTDKDYMKMSSAVITGMKKLQEQKKLKQ